MTLCRLGVTYRTGGGKPTAPLPHTQAALKEPGMRYVSLFCCHQTADPNDRMTPESRRSRVSTDQSGVVALF